MKENTNYLIHKYEKNVEKSSEVNNNKIYNV